MKLGLSDLLPATLMLEASHDGKYQTFQSCSVPWHWGGLSLSFENHVPPKCHLFVSHKKPRFQLSDNAFSHNLVAFLMAYCSSRRRRIISAQKGTLNPPVWKIQNRHFWRHMVFTVTLCCPHVKIKTNPHWNNSPSELKKRNVQHSSVTSHKLPARSCVVMRDGVLALLSVTVSGAAVIMITETAQIVPLCLQPEPKEQEVSEKHNSRKLIGKI